MMDPYTVYSTGATANFPPATGDLVRDAEKASILQFLHNHRNYLHGRVLDYGCGAQPYRSLVESTGAEYIGVDEGTGLEYGMDASTPKFDAILCTQVLQYIPAPSLLLCRFGFFLRPSGHLILTYPTNWDEVPNDRYGANFDRHRFTKLGMEELLPKAGKAGPFQACLSTFTILHHELRAVVQVGSFRFPLGYGLIARKDS